MGPRGDEGRAGRRDGVAAGSVPARDERDELLDRLARLEESNAALRDTLRQVLEAAPPLTHYSDEVKAAAVALGMDPRELVRRRRKARLVMTALVVLGVGLFLNATVWFATEFGRGLVEGYETGRVPGVEPVLVDPPPPPPPPDYTAP